MENPPPETSATDEVAEPDPSSPRSSRARLWRKIALVLGLVSAACALAFPFLPVTQDTAKIVWPTENNTQPVNAPLTAYWAQDMSVDIPCDTVQSVSGRTTDPAVLFSTVPPQRIEDGAGMQLTVHNNVLMVSNQGQQVAKQPLPETGCDIHYGSDTRSSSVSVADTPIFFQPGDVRARVVGIYTDISADQDPINGLGASITPDTRFQSSPTVWKVLVAVLGAATLVGSLVALNRSDTRVARRAPRWAPVGWWRLSVRDITVIGALAAWVIIGPVTADDGYILTMSRVAEDAGYLPNYHRWFGVAEAPIGWFDHLYQLMANFSVAPPWIRLPSFLLGVISWLLISREVMPRLGKEVRISPAAGWAAAMVFLVWWMPFNNGVRPEPVGALGALLALCAVERALTTRRLLPLCLGLMAAAFTCAATPTGLIAVAPYIVAARPLFHLLRQRAREGGWLPALSPILASGVCVLFAMFADQTFATVKAATALRTQVGPSMPWFEELTRYELLFAFSADGSVARRFPVLLLILCTGTCLVVLLRRGRIPGAALGPSRRLIGTVALFFVLLALTPTKWTHHFGAFAAVGGAMAALTALAVSSTVLRSKRNRAAFTAGLLLVAALAATGPNSYWFVSNLGLPWFDTAPAFPGIRLSTALLIGAGIAAVYAFISNVRAHRPGAPPPVPEGRGRALKLGSISLVAVCGVVAFGEFATMAKAISKQSDTYSMGAANFAHLFGQSCNLADHVRVERDPISSILDPLPDDQQQTLPKPTPPRAQPKPGQTSTPTNPPQAGRNSTEEPRKPAQPGGNGPDDPDGSTGDNGPNNSGPNNSGGNTKQPGNVPLPKPENDNGVSEAGFHTSSRDNKDPLDEPPHAFTTNTVRMWSSYLEQTPPTGELRTNWYGVPDKRKGKQVVVATNSKPGKATEVAIEFGKPTKDGMKVVRTNPVQGPGAGSGQWGDVRLGLDNIPDDATALRVVAKDNDLTEDGWIAVSAPRIPTFTSLTDRVDKEPVYMDWPAAFAYPCVNPMKVRDGISEMPKYRITAGSLAMEGGVADSKGGGPNGYLKEVADEPEVPSFLAGAPAQPWGKLMRVEPYEQGTEPTVVHGKETHWGWWSPAPMPAQPNGSRPTR